MSALASTGIGSYVPDLVRRWPASDPPYRRVDGALVSADISGFTALSERLAAYGREGAEELTLLLNQCFGGMIEIIDSYGGDVLKFGGDALLVLFTGAEATARAAAACVRMRGLIERRWSTELVKRIELGISQGVHAGSFNLHLVDAGHRELLVVGPGMSATVNCEGAAERGQILLSHEAAAELEPSVLGVTTPDGRALARSPHVDARADAPSVEFENDDVAPFVPSWLLEQTAAGRIAEHRTVTVGFVFFGGVDDLMLSDGPEAVHERLQSLASATERAASGHGVFWLASDVYAGGGKIILSAGAPKSTGQDEDAAVRAAKEILASDIGLPIRAGLNRGPVFMGDLGSDRRRTFTVMGDAVNLAARLMQKSAPGQLVASSGVLALVPTAFELATLEPFMVKGKSEPIHASLVGDQRSDLGAPEQRAGSDDEITFVGRTDELAVLREQLATVRSGAGRVVEVVGEPGIGKTRLISELLAPYEDLTVLRAKGGLYSRRTPYFAVSNMLRRLAGIEPNVTPAVAGRRMTEWILTHAPALMPWAPLLGIAFGADVPMTPEVERIDPANRAARLRDAVVDLLDAAIDGPLVIVVDDSHRLDEASDELFAVIGRRSIGHPWLLLGLRWSDHSTYLDQVGGLVTVEVGPLTPGDTRSIVHDAMSADGSFDEDDIDALVSRGVTNPLFLLELVRAGIGGDTATPDSIEALVTARIDTLGPADRLLLREAAVLGSQIDVALLAEATGQPELRRSERWDALSGFLERDSRTLLHFRQGLYREVAYQGLSFRRRRRLHADVGQVLERRAGEDWESASELLSLHFHEAQDWSRSWRYSVIAGDRARSKYAHAEAAEFYGRALAVPTRHRPGPAAVAPVAESMGDALELDGQLGRAEEVLALARRTCVTTEMLVRLMRKEGVIRERQGKYSQALRWYGRGLTAVTELPPTTAKSEEGQLSLAYAGVRFRQGRLHDSIELAHRAERLAREIDDPKMLAHASYLLMIGYGVLRRPDVVRYRELPLQLFEELGDLVGQANVLNNLGVEAHDESRWTEALEYYERSRIARQQAGDVIGAATAANNIAEILSDQGHLDEARALFEQALRSWRRAGYEVGVAVATGYLGRLHARTGEYDTARRMLAEAVERFERIGASHFVLETKAYQLECEVLAGNGRAATTGVEALFKVAHELGDPLLEVKLLRAKGWAHLIEREYDEAEEIANRCLELSESVGSSYEAAMALIMRGQVMRATGRDRLDDHRRARELLSELGVVSLPRRAGS
jgi:class 3 adenylate cyclase/tetratricopeptide (TPR) repeat protein